MQKRYDQEFKATIVELYQSGQSVGSLASEYGLTTSTIYKWIHLYSKNEQGTSQAELLALKKELAKVKEERDILKKSIDHIRRKRQVSKTEMMTMIQEE